MRRPSRRAWREGILGALAVGIAATMAPFVNRLLGARRPRFVYAVGSMNPAGPTWAAGGGWEAARTVVAPGISLNGIVRRPSRPAAPWILFFPGNDATQLETAQKFLDRVRGDDDWGLAVWAYRGFASSEGVPDREGLVGDATRIFESLLESERLDPTRVHLAGFSLGGYLAASVVGVAVRAGRKPASLSLLAAAEDIVMVRASWAQRFVAGDDYEIRSLLDAVPSPALVVQGSADEALGVEQGRRIAASLGARARYVELAGVGHNALLESEAASRAVHAMVVASSGERPPSH
jgi:pimeloyl-ACP methyl ester carboxylesterase